MITTLRGENLLSMDDLSRGAIVEILDTAESFVEVNQRTIKKVPALRGRVVASLFFEESTRTRLSFETAANGSVPMSCLWQSPRAASKRANRFATLSAPLTPLGIDAVVMRHQSSGAALQVSRYVPHVRVINGGDGQHQHPTQGLLDAFTIRQVLAERRGTTGLESGAELFAGLKVLIVGDLRHSRVARSDVDAYVALGADVRVAAPARCFRTTLRPGRSVSRRTSTSRSSGRTSLACCASNANVARIVCPDAARIYGHLWTHA